MGEVQYMHGGIYGPQYGRGGADAPASGTHFAEEPEHHVLDGMPEL
jgi:hypothetical protein